MSKAKGNRFFFSVSPRAAKGNRRTASWEGRDIIAVRPNGLPPPRVWLVTCSGSKFRGQRHSGQGYFWKKKKKHVPWTAGPLGLVRVRGGFGFDLRPSSALQLRSQRSSSLSQCVEKKSANSLP